jgi:hypothetical protein
MRSPGSSRAIIAAALAVAPLWGWTFTCSAPKTSFARLIASVSTSSTNSQPP